MISNYRANAESTAISACNHIAELALYDPYIARLLYDCLPSFNDTLLAELQHDLGANCIRADMDPLLASSRKALISITEVGIQKSWSYFYMTSAPGGIIALPEPDEWRARMETFLVGFNEWFLKYVFLPKVFGFNLTFFSCLLREDTLVFSFLGLRHILHNAEITTAYVTSFHDDDRWPAQSEALINIVHHLLSALTLWIQLAIRNEIPPTVIDWDTLEALLGREGKEPVWSSQLQGLISAGSQFGAHEEGIVEELEIVR